MNNVIKFNFCERYVIRTILIDSEPWFVAKDVTDALGFKNGRQAASQHVPAGQTQAYQIETPGDVVPYRDFTVISEPGLYRLIMRSNVEKAEPFQAWVTEQVLPAIRKHGAYATDEVVSGLFEQGVDFYGQASQHHTAVEIQQQLEQMVADKSLNRSKLNLHPSNEFQPLSGIRKVCKTLNEFAGTKFTPSQVIAHLTGKNILFKKGKTLYPHDEYRHLFYHFEGNDDEGLLTYNIVMTDTAQIFVAKLLGIETEPDEAN